MTNNTCDFCDEFSEDTLARQRCLYPETMKPRLIFSRGNFNVFPCLGSLEFGHLLIATTYHATAFTSVPSEDSSDLDKVVAVIVKKFKQELSLTPAFFEHGDPTGLCELQGPCVSHAHLHVAPNGQQILAKLRKSRIHTASSKLSNRTTAVEEPYLMCTDQEQIAHYFSAEGTPRQYLRQLYSESLSRPDDWNWAANVDFERTAEEASNLRRLFSDISGI